MSAPSIPNLLSLRGARGGARGRRRGGGPASTPGASGTAPSANAIIQGTDTDAAVSRLSAVDLGYLDDPFAPHFVSQQPSQHGMPPSSGLVRRLPIINRGTYTRTTALDRLIEAFLNPGDDGPTERQIISLGAGTDTRCFRILAGQMAGRTTGLTYHEIDFAPVTSKKLQLVRSIPALRSILPNASHVAQGSGFSASTAQDGPPDLQQNLSSWACNDLPGGCRYFCHGLDLRSLAQQKPQQERQQHTPEVPGTAATDSALGLTGLRTDIPTLLLSECCLCYLEIPEAEGVVRYFTSQIPTLALALYEPIHPNDPFGRQMTANLAARRIHMPTVPAYPDVAGQAARLQALGFIDGVRGMTVEDIWDSWISDEEKERVDGLEGLDELEEWKLLAAHYVVAWGWRGHGHGCLNAL